VDVHIKFYGTFIEIDGHREGQAEAANIVIVDVVREAKFVVLVRVLKHLNCS